MSNRYKGGVISATPPTTTGGNDGVASGAWTLEQQMQAQAAGLWPNQPIFYIEDVFSTYLYTGNGSTQTITNGINLSGKGGLVWVKLRSGAVDHYLTDSARGVGNYFSTNSSRAQNGFGTVTNAVTSFNTDGFSLGADTVLSWVNESASTYASWTFRKQPKFFDIVTYTGNQAVGQNIPHNLGSAPGLIIVKAYEGDSRNWFIYHRSLGATKHLVFTTAAETTQTDIWNNTEPTSTVFTVGDSSNVNQNGRLYIAYLFAHDAGGFGLTGTDNVISCGSYTGTGAAGNAITLGYEPQWLMVKNASTGGQNWEMFDNMRGLPTGGSSAELFPNTTGAERNSFNVFNVTATGFVTGTSVLDETNASGNTYIYIAIRRGPMKVPTVGTSVFSPTSTTSATTPLSVTTNFPVDMAINRYSGTSSPTYVFSRLTGAASNGTLTSVYLQTNSTAAETAPNAFGDSMVSNTALIDYAFLAGNSNAKIYWNFGRAPSFFDVVCYTGTGVARTVTHNLSAVPELMIVKRRQLTQWCVYHSATGPTKYATLNDTAAFTTSSDRWNDTSPTSSVFTVGTDQDTNTSGGTYVAYLFATCAGVSKVGSYVGTHDTTGPQTINCGFTSGARFVMIKIVNSSYGWWVFDTARGINPPLTGDPYLELNSTSAESTLDMINPDSSGFIAFREATNIQGVTYIFLAIA